MPQYTLRVIPILFAAAGLIAPLPRAAYGQPSGTTVVGPVVRKLPQCALAQIGTDNLRTRDFITQLAFSPDGKHIAAVAANAEFPTVYRFDVATGKPVKQLSVADALQSRTSCTAFSPDGANLLWGESDGHLALWDLAAGRLLFREKLHTADVNAVVYSRRGNIVATCSANGEIQLRNANDLAEPVRLVSVGDAAPRAKGAGFGEGAAGGYALAFTPNGEQLIVGSKNDGQLYVWNVTNGELDHKVKLAHGTGQNSFNPSLNSLAVTPDGRQIMTAGQRTVPREQTKLKYESKNVTLSQIYLWDLQTGKRNSVVNGDEDLGLGYAAVSPDGKSVAVGDFSHLNLWEVGGNKLGRTIALPGWWGNQPVFSPDGALVAVAVHNAIGLYEVSTGKRLHHDDQTPIGDVRSAAWSPDGNRIVTGHYDGYVRSWDSQTGKLFWCHELAPVISLSGYNAGPSYVGFTPNGKSVVVVGRRDEPVEYLDGIIAILDADSGNSRREITLKRLLQGALSPNGEITVGAMSHGAANDTHLFAFDVATGKSLFVTPPEEQRGGFWMVRALQFGADSSDLLLATGSGEVFRLDAATGREKQKFVADYRTPQQIEAKRPREPQLWEGDFSADGKTLVSSSAEWIYVWDVDSGGLRLQIRHPHDHGCKLCFAPDGKTLATSDILYAGDYGTDMIRLYDIDTADELLTLEAPGNRAGVMSFSPDGKRLFTGFHRGSGIEWDVAR